MGETCIRCQHQLAGHVVVATSGPTAYGGIALCSVWRCRCLDTWAIGGRKPHRMLDPVDTELARARVQNRCGWDGAALNPPVSQPVG